MMKKLLCSIMAVFALSAAAFAAEPPVLRVSYGITTHQEAFMVAMALGEKFKDKGIYLKPVVEKEKFDLMMNGKKVARLNVIVTKSGSEAASLFAQNHLDLTTNSFPAMLSAIDRGTKIKVLSPLQSDAIAMVARKDVGAKGWDGFRTYVKKSAKPVTVGYHSPTSAPKIVFEGAMDSAGLRITEDANATKADADILMIDLKGIANVIPAMVAKATPCGNTTSAPVAPATRSSRRVCRLTIGHQRRKGKRARMLKAGRFMGSTCSGRGCFRRTDE